MKLTLSKDIQDALATPAEDGLIRATVALRLGEDGSATIVSIEDIPVDPDGEDESKEEKGESEIPEMPDTSGAMQQLGQF